MTRLAAILAVTLLAACGADGPPERPTDAPPPGISITGEASIGVTL